MIASYKTEKTKQYYTNTKSVVIFLPKPILRRWITFRTLPITHNKTRIPLQIHIKE